MDSLSTSLALWLSWVTNESETNASLKIHNTKTTMHETHAKLALMNAASHDSIGLEKKELDCWYYWGEEWQVSLHSYYHYLFYNKPTWYEF